VACQSSPSGSGDGSGGGAPAPGSGSGAASPAEPAGDGSGAGAPGEVGAGSGAGAGASAAAPETVAAPELQALMRRAGFTPAGEADVAEFVPVPPGATAEAGSFVAGERTVRVVVVAYPNPRYARPHVTDVLERRRLVPSAGDAVLSRGPVVVQVHGATRADADETAAALQRLLEWPEPTDVTVTPAP
jgi:hypothetical protein